MGYTFGNDTIDKFTQTLLNLIFLRTTPIIVLVLTLDESDQDVKTKTCFWAIEY